MCFHDLFDNRKPQAGRTGDFLAYAIETLEHILLFALGYSPAVITNGYVEIIVVALGFNLDLSAVIGLLDRIGNIIFDYL